MVAVALTGTAAQQQPAVDVASIKRNVTVRGPLPPNVIWLAGDRMSATGLTLAELIRSAFVGDGIQLMNQIVGGPGWTTSERFDVVGKLTGIQTGNPDETNRQRQAALKALLADRFGLKAHVEKRELPVFDLVLAAKDGKLGPEIKASTCGANGNRPCVLARMIKMDPAAGITMGYEGMTMTQFASALVSVPDIGRTVRNRTGLSGTFDLQLTMAIPQGPNATGDSGVFTALQEQLGLKLEGRRDQVDVIVIDRAGPPTED
jgi:uncharacterized protein (TIGR03435 family)